MQKSLGRGLKVLIPKKTSKLEKEYFEELLTKPKQKEAVFNIEVEKIFPNPHQPRKDFDKKGLEELAQSIKDHGIIQPLIVAKIEKEKSKGRDVEYQLIAGERRLQAAKLAKLDKVPVIVRDANDLQKLQLALIENIQRWDLNALEEAEAFKKLNEDFSFTHNEIAEKIGKSREYVTNTIRLLSLPALIKKEIIKGRITPGHARAILSIDENEKKRDLVRRIISKDLSVRDTELLARKVATGSYVSKTSENTDSKTQDIILRLEKNLRAKVEISPSKNGGRASFQFFSANGFKNFLKRLSGF